jgi:NAD(P)-dependent dehydrogenase (short-subunit alcohol dehydrogenase family)
MPLRQHGVYLITGGSGGIGLAIAAYLAQTFQARLVLVSRNGLPQRNQWPQILQQSDPQSIEARQISQILQLEEMGSEVLILQADVANEARMRTVLEQAHSRFGAIHGVFHAAGVPGIGLMQLKTSEQAAAVLSPKVQGTLVLERVLQEQATSLDFLMLFSSVTAIVGGPGQADYAAANAFLDAYARSSKAPYRVLSVDWGEWQWNAWEKGLAGYGEMAEFLRENRKRFGLTFEEGIAALQRVLTCDLPQIIVSTQVFDQVIALGNNFTITSIAQQQQQQQKAEMARRPELETSYVAPRNELERKIAALWAKLLYIEQIGIHDNFFDLGGNSLLGMELIAQTKKLCGIADLPSYTLYEAPSVAAMAHLLGRSEPVGIVDKTRDRSERRRESLKQKARGNRSTR